MDPFSLTTGCAGLITVVLQTAEYLNSYIGAIKDRKQEIEDFHQELLLLGNVLSQLRDFVSLQKSQETTFDTNCVLRKAISDCNRRLEKVGDRLRPSKGGRIARTIDKLKWPFDREEVQNLMNGLQRFLQVFTFALTTQGLLILAKSSEQASAELEERHGVSQKMTEMCKQMEMSSIESERKTAQLEQILILLPTLVDQSNDIREMSQHLRLAEEREQARQKSEILNWLAPVSNMQRHVETQKKRVSNTCEWFLQTTQFQEWQTLENPPTDLICMGNPGVGKTVLSSIVFDHLSKKYSSQQAIILNYYCSHFEIHTQTTSHFIRTLLRQVCQALDRLPTAVVDFYRKTQHTIEDVLWVQELQSILHRTIATCDHIFLVIDALDEVENIRQRNAILQTFKQLKTANPTFRVLATTRPHVSELHSYFHLPSTVDIAARPHDIEIYLRKRFEEQSDLGMIIDAELEQEIITRLSTNAGGTFLLPALQLEHILQQVTKADVKRALSGLSKTIDEAFKTSLDRIRGLPSTRKDIALRSMMWISHAKRPLLMVELQQALAVREGDKDFDKDNVVPSRIILESCSGLVQLDKDSGTTSFVHFSLDEYLQTQARDIFDTADCTIVRVCLTFLSFSTLRQLPSMSRTNFIQLISDMPFIKYAASEWGYHASHLEINKYSDLALPFFNNSMNLLALSRIRDMDSPAAADWRRKTTSWAFSGGAGISLSAYYGLVDLTRHLLKDVSPSTINTCRNMYGSLALHEAAAYGHTSVCQVLIEHGANVMDTNNGKGTPFYQAVSYDRIETAQALLVYNRAQLDITHRFGWTALHKAAEIGSETLVQFLLSSGALVAARDDQYRTALHIAAERGHLAITQMLVLAGADMTVVSRMHTPLDLAATCGKASVVKYLLEQGDNVNRIGRDSWTPLFRACRGGHVEAAQVLVQNGAYLHFQGMRNMTALHLAARSGNLALVKLILEHDPSSTLRMLQRRDKNKNTPQHISFFTAHFDIYKYLRNLEQQLLAANDLQLQIYDPVLPLTLSIEANDLTSVELLVKNNPELLHTADKSNQLPLHVAFVEEASEIAEFLLKAGASIDAPGFHAWQPLHIAASTGSLKMTQLALAHGANVNAVTESFQTPLLKAASSYSLPVMRCLLQAGADPRAINDRKMTSLHVAAGKNFLDGIRELMHPEWGAQEVVHWRDKSKDLPRQWAERSGHLEAATYLRLQEKLIKSHAKNPEWATSSPDLSRTNTSTSQLSLVSYPSSETRSSTFSNIQPNDRLAQLVLEMDSD